MTLNLLLALPALIPVALLFWAIFSDKKKRVQESKRPFRRKLFRLPGEFAAQKAHELSEKGEVGLYGVAFTSAFAFLFILFTSLNSFAIGIILALLFLISALCLRSLHKNYTEFRSWSLGALGERVVGDQLMREFLPLGFKVYHDIQQTRGFDDRKFNYDHILVDHRGVFLIETKTRSKKRGDQSADAHKLTTSGDRINFPNGEFDLEIIPKLKENAEQLSESLSEFVASNVPVYPILVYPGWDVYHGTNVPTSPLCDSRDLLKETLKKPEKALNEKNLARVTNRLEELARNIDQNHL